MEVCPWGILAHMNMFKALECENKIAVLYSCAYVCMYVCTDSHVMGSYHSIVKWKHYLSQSFIIEVLTRLLQ